MIFFSNELTFTSIMICFKKKLVFYFEENLEYIEALKYGGN